MSNKICRTCLSSTDELYSVFDEVYVNNEQIEIIQMILICTGLEITKYDEFSHDICYACTEEVIKSYEYRDKCWKSQLFLMNQFKAKVADEYFSDNLDDIKDEEEDLILESDTNEIDHFENNYEEEFIDSTDDENHDEVKKDSITEPEPVVEQSKKRVVPTYDDDFIKYVNYTYDDTCLYGKRYFCLRCDQIYVRPVTIRDHLIKIHGIVLEKRDGFECITCGKVFDRKKQLNTHLKIHEPPKYTCEICGVVLKGKETLVEHKRRHTGEKPFKCEICDFRSAQKRSMDIHRRVHTGEKPYKCHICGVAYKTASARANHRRKHSDERPFECIVCSKKFKTREGFKRHMQTHDSQESIECDFCQKKFPPARIKFHLQQHSSKPTYKCELCGQSFYQGASFQRHMKNRHYKDDGIENI